MNACLTYGLAKNLSVIYELLYQKAAIIAMLPSLKQYAQFSDLASNIEIVVHFFDEKMKKYSEQEYLRLKESGELNGTPINSGSEVPSPTKNPTDLEQGVELSSPSEQSLEQYIKKKIWSVEEVQQVLELGARSWRGHELAVSQKITDSDSQTGTHEIKQIAIKQNNANVKQQIVDQVSFVYEEVGNPEDFFVPYIWSIIVKEFDSWLWDVSKARISISSPTEETGTAADPKSNGSAGNSSMAF